MNKATYRYIFLVYLLLFPTVMVIIAQDTTKISPYMLLSYLKDTDSHRILEVKMTNITQTGETPLPGLAIQFYNHETLLSESITNSSGTASYTIPGEYVLFSEADGSWPFAAQFAGDGAVEAASGELSITDVILGMDLAEEDGKKIVTLSASLPTPTGNMPVVGEEISVFIPRMFSLLPVGTGTFGADGTVEIPFPDGLPGDSIGNLTVIGRFNDHYLYGNVERREQMEWGITVVKPPEIYRSLWTTLAPTWMIVTLSIMLFGVWGHYMYVLISLFRIRKDGLKKKE
jgi:hypothetical protein